MHPSFPVAKAAKYNILTCESEEVAVCVDVSAFDVSKFVVVAYCDGHR